MKIIVIGPRGKMGKLITQVAASRDDMELIAGVAPKGRDYIGTDLGTVAMVGRELGVPVVDDLEKVIDACDVIIDFSTKEMGMEVLDLALAHKKGLVCGTTGFSPEEMARFKDASKEIPMLYAANTSKLVNIMNKLLELVVRTAGNDLDIEILEMHDQWKKDAPSGTCMVAKEFLREYRELLVTTLCAQVIFQAVTPYISEVLENVWKLPIIPTTGNVLQEEPVTALHFWLIKAQAITPLRMY